MTLYKLKPFPINSENEIEALIHHNELLDFEGKT